MELERIAREVRKSVVMQVYEAQSGHPGGALSCVDILVAIYFQMLQDGDKVILSKGHASAALYAVLAEKRIIDKQELKNFRKLGSSLQGHPSLLKTHGVDASSGSLGQGLSIANGMALAFQLDNKEQDVYVVLGDGEIQEGQIWEAAMTASHYRLNHVIAFLDYNGLQIDGSNEEVMRIAPVKEKFESFGWYTQEINGHCFDEIIVAIQNAKQQEKPSMIIAHTIKGKGVSFMENQCSWHGKAPNQEQYKNAMFELEKE